MAAYDNRRGSDNRFGGNNNFNRNGSAGPYRGGQNTGYTNYGKQELPPEIQPKPVPENYVDEAEKVLREVMQDNGKPITTSQIRNILSLAIEIYNTENLRTEKKLLPGNTAKINLMRVRVAYQCGREDTVKKFIEKAHILEYLKGISDDREDFIRFAHYMEALVAYHRYFNGKEV